MNRRTVDLGVMIKNRLYRVQLEIPSHAPTIVEDWVGRRIAEMSEFVVDLVTGDIYKNRIDHNIRSIDADDDDLLYRSLLRLPIMTLEDLVAEEGEYLCITLG